MCGRLVKNIPIFKKHRVMVRSTRASSSTRASRASIVEEEDKENTPEPSVLREADVNVDKPVAEKKRAAPKKSTSATPRKSVSRKSVVQESVPEPVEEEESKQRYSDWYAQNFQGDKEAAPEGPAGAKKASPVKSTPADAGLAAGQAGSREGGNIHPLFLVIAILVAVIAFGMFGMMQKGGMGGPPSSAEIAKLQQQHSAIVAENKKIIKELKQLEAAVSSDQSGAAIARLDKQLEKLSSAHKEIAGKQERGSAEHDKVVAQLTELRKELGKQGKELSKELSKQIEVVKGDLAKAKKEMGGAAVQQHSDGEVSALSKTSKEMSARVEKLAKDIEKISAGSLGAAAKSSLDLEEIKKAVREEALKASKVDVAALKKEVMDELEVMIKKEVKSAAPKSAPKQAPAGSADSWSSFIGFDLTSKDGQIETAVKTVLRRLHNERVGSVDWALAVNNAQIVSHSPTYDICKNEGILGSGTCQIRSALQPALQLTPSTVLKAEGISRSTLEDSGASYLGHCWAMSGGHGFITVKLDRPVSPSQFVLEHAPPRISPSAGTSAPNKFRLIGWSGPVNDRAGKGSTTGEEELVSGAYLIDDSNSDSVFPHIQRFDVASARAIDHVRLEIESNHGNSDFTCLYHFRLHGDAAPAAAKA